MTSQLETYRYFLKDSIRKEIDFTKTDQSSGVKPPPVQKPYCADLKTIDLIRPKAFSGISRKDLTEAIHDRKSHRHFKDQPLTIGELSFLLWATQGIRRQVDAATAMRTVPSAGARHAFETYLCIFNVEGVQEGIFRYLPLEHQLLFIGERPDLRSSLIHASFNQFFSGSSAVTFIWSAIPYRMEWRYDLAAHKVILLDAGHVCQNLYLACEAIGAGTCAIAAYDQELIDDLIGLDGNDEFVIYMAPVGKVS